MREAASKHKLRIKRLEWTERDIRKCQYNGLLDDKELVWFEVGTMTPKIKKVLEKIKLRKRLVIFDVDTREQKNWLLSIQIDEKTTDALHIMTEWKDKEEACLQMLGKFRADFTSDEVRKRMISMMIRDPECWSDVRLSIDIARRKREAIGLPFLQDMFPNMEFYRVDDWVREVLEGKKKQKTIKVAHYFLHTKGYSSVWLMNRIREKLKDVSLVYEAYRRGIVYHEMTKGTIVTRSKVAGWVDGEQLADMKPGDQRWCLRVIEDLPYPYFVKVQRILYAGDEIVSEDWGLYRYLEELRLARGEYEVEKMNKLSKQN